MFFRLLQDVNQLFDIFHSLVRPLYGNAPFFTAQQHSALPHQGDRQVILLSPVYAKDNSPITQTCSMEPTNLLAAVASWDNRVRYYYDDIINLESTQLRPIHAAMVQHPTGIQNIPHTSAYSPHIGFK
jgi:hypothetical protein